MRLTDFEPLRLDELAPATLASYKTKAGAAATAADAAGDRKTADKRFSGIVKATKKQFDQDAKGVSEDSDDTVRFEVDSENAYNHVMDQFGSVIDWDGDTMVAPRKYWGAIQELALAASGEASEEQGVAEGFDQPYSLKWEKSDYGDVDALAKLPDGSPLSIMFNLADMSENDWGVEFYRNNSQSVTGEGDAQRIFATVLTAIGKFVKKKKPDTLFFSTVKEEDPTGSRAKLYDRLVQRYATGLGYDLKKVEYPEQTGYKLTRKEQGVAEGSLNEARDARIKRIQELSEGLSMNDLAKVPMFVVDSFKKAAFATEREAIETKNAIKIVFNWSQSTPEQKQAAKKQMHDIAKIAAGLAIAGAVGHVGAAALGVGHAATTVGAVAQTAIEHIIADLGIEAVAGILAAGGINIVKNALHDITTSSGHEFEKQQYQQGVKQRIKTQPLAGPAGHLPEQGMAEGSAADGSVNYTLGHTPDAEYVYHIYRDGKKEGTYHSVDQAREIMGNMMLTRPNREYKIKRGTRNKMAGPTGQLPEAQGRGVSEDALAGMKRLAGIASAQTPTTPGQRQYRHMPTAVQPR